MTLTLAERTPIWWCVAVSGSTSWRLKWRIAIERELDEQISRRCRSGDTFVLRHGGAREGVDRIAHEWFAARKGLYPGITMIEEIVAADWATCVTSSYQDVRGKVVSACRPDHRRPSRHSTASDGCICPSAGHRRNPDVVVHPDYPVDVLLAFCVNDSPGTTATVACAKRYEVNYQLCAFYPKPASASPTVRNDRSPRWVAGDNAHPGGDLHDVELAGS